MGIKPVCDKCGKELGDFGALLFGPPENNKPENTISVSPVIKGL